MKTKSCTECEKTQSLKSFPKNKRCKDGVRTVCKSCVSKYRKKWWENGGGKEKQRDTNLKRAYGISSSEWQRIFELQKGCCASCGRHQSNVPKSLHVDHCHKSGKVRALLCDRCNRALGIMDEDAISIRKLAEYANEYC